MMTIGALQSDGQGRARRRLAKVAGFATGIVMFGTVGLSGALAQDEGIAVGADAGAMVNSIIAGIFADVFGGDVSDDGATVSGTGDFNVGGNTGGTVTMGGTSSGITIGNTGGGITVGDESGG